jgi:endogenous inhibitor of DNA gyrase (YacG/DUF329 family)
MINPEEQCVTCQEDIPAKSPSDYFCSSICQQTWMEGNAEWPTWAYSWNGKNRKGEKTSTQPYYWPNG